MSKISRWDNFLSENNGDVLIHYPDGGRVNIVKGVPHSYKGINPGIVLSRTSNVYIHGRYGIELHDFFVPGTEFWFKYGNYHRIDGPAIKLANAYMGYREYYINDTWVRDYIRTTKQIQSINKLNRLYILSKNKTFIENFYSPNSYGNIWDKQDLTRSIS